MLSNNDYKLAAQRAKAILSDSDKIIKLLKKAGILTPKGDIAKPYK